jgi:hypothetical protein
MLRRLPAREIAPLLDSLREGRRQPVMRKQVKSNFAVLTQYPRVYSMDARTQRALDAIATAPLGLVIGISILDVAGLVDKALAPLCLGRDGVFRWDMRPPGLSTHSSASNSLRRCHRSFRVVFVR